MTGVRVERDIVFAGPPPLLDLVPGGTHMFSGLDDAALRALIGRSMQFLLQPTAR